MYSLLPALVSVYFLFAAYYLCKHTQKLKRSHKAFLLLCITTFFWQATWAILFQTTDPDLSRLLTQFGYLLIIILPTSLYQLLAEISDNQKERPYINFSYFISVLLIAILINTDHFIDGYYEYFWGNYPRAGALHWVHVVQTIVVVLRGLFVASIREKSAKEPQKSILKCCKFSVFIYFLAASDYLCNYGVEFYPLGILFVTTSLTIIGYAMVKKDLFDIRVIISRTASQLIVASMIALSFVIINGFQYQLISFVIIANTCIGITWAMYWESLTQKIQTAAKKKWITDWYDATEIFNQITKKLYNHIEKKKIIEELAEILEKSMSIKSKSVYVINNKKHYHLDGSNTQVKNQLQNKIQFILKKNTDVLHGRDIGLCDKSLVLVIRSSTDVEGIVILSSRYSENPYNSDDIKLLAAVTQQSKLFLDNANRHEEKLKYVKSLAGTIAHEMRNPLSQINGTLHLLWKEQTKTFPESDIYINNLQQIIKNSFQLIDITMDAINEKPIRKSDFKIISALDICTSAVSEYAYKESEHRNKVSVTGSDFKILADPVLVKYILYNLIGNALYYVQSNPKANIVVKLHKDQRKIEVRDTGPGIAPESLSKLFDSFYTSNKTGGTGLGLAYCKRSMHALDGDIHCISELGKFTSFILTFPEHCNQSTPSRIMSQSV